MSPDVLQGRELSDQEIEKRKMKAPTYDDRLTWVASPSKRAYRKNLVRCNAAMIHLDSDALREEESSSNATCR